MNTKKHIIHIEINSNNKKSSIACWKRHRVIKSLVVKVSSAWIKYALARKLSTR